jgi:hypothetical protein
MVAKCLVPGTVGCFDPIDHVIVLLRINHANIVHLLIADERVPGAEFADHDGAKDRLFAAGPGNDLTDPAPDGVQEVLGRGVPGAGVFRGRTANQAMEMGMEGQLLCLSMQHGDPTTAPPA